VQMFSLLKPKNENRVEKELRQICVISPAVVYRLRLTPPFRLFYMSWYEKIYVEKKNLCWLLTF
jgi:hypothetical protein